jgi:hypothetical protein
MTKLLEQAIAQAKRLPDEEQDAAANALLTFLDSASDIHLTDEQAAEIRRRRAESRPVTMTLAELDERLRRRGL